MKRSKLLILLLVVANFCYAQSFTLKDVHISGLQRITASSFFNYLPVQRGERVGDADYPKIIRALYQTGFFSDIQLARDGNVLVVRVKERPIIGKINISGNKELKRKDLVKGLVSLGMGEGDSFDEVKLAGIEKELLELYHSRSKFDVIIDATSHSLGQGRVALDIAIREGISARIKQINFVGNKAFSEADLLGKIRLTPSKWYSILNRNDRYSGEKLQADIDTVEAFYYDRGFLDFKINSTQVSLTGDKKDVYITINLTEGLPYRIDKTALPGSEVLNKAQMKALLTYTVGDYYSRKKVRESQQKIKNLLGEKGYAFANVRVVPKLDKRRHSVVLTYALLPGKKTYVRRVEFNGNYSTNDKVLRREMRQLEAAPYNYTKLKRSDERIQRLSYITAVKHRTVPVSGRPDQVDVIYDVKETSGRSLVGGIGYGHSSGFLFNLGYVTSNFLGTGNYFNFDFNSAKASKNYALSFTDPYFTANGVSRTFSLYYNSTNQAKKDIGDWSSDTAGSFFRFGFPISEYEAFSLGAGYRKIKIKTGNSVASEIKKWLVKKGNNFNEFVADFNWTHDTRDKTIFATKGSITRLNAEVAIPGSTETYYKLGIRNRSYFQLSENLLTAVRGDVSYGDGYGRSDGLPFFRNYYAGGLTTIRGFSNSSLGPKWSNGKVKGGNFRVTGGAELILPLTFGQEAETVRTGLFVDFGNVYDQIKSFSTDDFRYSAGAYILWRSPIGALNISYAIPLNEKAGDKTERFQFTVGVPF